MTRGEVISASQRLSTPRCMFADWTDDKRHVLHVSGRGGRPAGPHQSPPPQTQSVSRRDLGARGGAAVLASTRRLRACPNFTTSAFWRRPLSLRWEVKGACAAAARGGWRRAGGSTTHCASSRRAQAIAWVTARSIDGSHWVPGQEFKAPNAWELFVAGNVFELLVRRRINRVCCSGGSGLPPVFRVSQRCEQDMHTVSPLVLVASAV